MDILLLGYITFFVAIIGVIASLAMGIHHAVTEHQERAYLRRRGRR